MDPRTEYKISASDSEEKPLLNQALLQVDYSSSSEEHKIAINEIQPADSEKERVQAVLRILLELAKFGSSRIGEGRANTFTRKCTRYSVGLFLFLMFCGAGGLFFGLGDEVRGEDQDPKIVLWSFGALFVFLGILTTSLGYACRPRCCDAGNQLSTAHVLNILTDDEADLVKNLLSDLTINLEDHNLGSLILKLEDCIDNKARKKAFLLGKTKAGDPKIKAALWENRLFSKDPLEITFQLAGLSPWNPKKHLSGKTEEEQIETTRMTKK